MSRLAVPQTGAVLLHQQQAAPRLLLQTSRRTIGARPVFGSTQGPVSRQFRRGVSSETAPVPLPPKKSRFRVLRWAWRLGYLSAIAGIGYIGYGVYQDRHPPDQIQPDPSKKTLVILGELLAVAAPPRLSRIR
jgi:NADH:ubiquinone reductase (non-electrogenic)